MATRETIGKILVILTAAYPRQAIPPDTARAYADLLADIDDQVLVAAAQHHAATNKWFPAVAELREAAYDVMARAMGVRSAEEAWVHVEEAVRRFGWYGETIPLEEGGGWRLPAMLSDLERRAIEGLGGWKCLCASENAPADRAHFLKIYAGLLAREQSTAQLLPAVQSVIGEFAAAARARALPGAPGGCGLPEPALALHRTEAE